MTKAETRELAAEAGMENAGKHESQDICFVPDGKYADFIEHFTGKTYPPGDLSTGKEIFSAVIKGLSVIRSAREKAWGSPCRDRLMSGKSIRKRIPSVWDPMRICLSVS